MKNALFHGPYSDNEFLSVEQQQEDKPQFNFSWVLKKEEDYVCIVFYESKCLKPQSFISVSANVLEFYDFNNQTFIYRNEFELDSDGDLILKNFP